MGWVYLIQNGDLHKIGRTNNLDRRLQQLKPDKVVAVFETDRSRDLEHELHQQFKTKRLPQSEYFRLSEAEVDSARKALGSWEPLSALGNVRRQAHLSLGAVVATLAAFYGVNALTGHGFVADLGVGLLAVAVLFAFLTASAALLVTSLAYVVMLIWQQSVANRVAGRKAAKETI